MEITSANVVGRKFTIHNCPDAPVYKGRVVQGYTLLHDEGYEVEVLEVLEGGELAPASSTVAFHFSELKPYPLHYCGECDGEVYEVDDYLCEECRNKGL